MTHATSKQLTELHEAVANLLLAAIAVHVLAVIAYRVVLKEDLVRPMLGGDKLLSPQVPPSRSLGRCS